MSRRTNRLRVVGENEDEPVSLTNEFKEAMDQWQFLESRIAGLIRKQDEEIGEALTNRSKYQELQSVISDVEKEQTNLLSDIVGRPSGNLHDVVAKLQLWMQINAPAEGAWVNPSDHLVASVVRDLSDLVSEV